MALVTINQLFSQVPGAKKLKLVEIIGDAAYVAGGSVITAALLGLNRLLQFIPLATSDLTMEAKWDQVNSKIILAVTSTGLETANGDKSAVKIYGIAIGN